jgi:hypothetical protein
VQRTRLPGRSIAVGHFRRQTGEGQPALHDDSKAGSVPEPLVTDADAAPGWSPWRIVVGFGLVSLTGDVV